MDNGRDLEMGFLRIGPIVNQLMRQTVLVIDEICETSLDNIQFKVIINFSPVFFFIFTLLS